MAYSAAARDPGGEHPFAVGRELALGVGYPPELLAIGLLERGERRRPRSSTVELLAGALRLDHTARAELVAAARANAPTVRSEAPRLPAPVLRAMAVAAALGLLAGAFAAWRALVRSPQPHVARVTAPAHRGGASPVVAPPPVVIPSPTPPAGPPPGSASGPPPSPGPPSPGPPVLASVAVTVAATPPPVAGPAVAQAMSRPSGTGVVWWGPQHYVHVTFRLSHLQPGTTYPLGLFSAPCGQSATLLDAFPGVDPTSTGTSSQTIYSRSPLANGVPAGTSLRLGSPVPRDTDSSVNAAVGLGCADIGRPISTVNGSESITVS